MLTAMKTVKKSVWDLLQKWPETRDCDATMYAYYLWFHTDLRKQLGDDNAKRVLKLIRGTRPPESIRRVRQKWQENGHFRGQKYQQRKQKAVEVQYNINDIM